jgi:hypothetical protein
MEMLTEGAVNAAGDALAERLVELGADVDQAERICFAFGQRASAMEASGRPVDLAALADRIVERFRNGQWDEPGPELALRLILAYPPRLGLLIAQLARRAT